MSPEEQASAMARIENLLTEQLDLAKDTNKVVRSIRRANRFGFWLKLLLWTAAIVIPIFFIGPILRTILPGSSGNAVNLLGIPTPAEIQKLMQTYRPAPSR